MVYILEFIVLPGQFELDKVRKNELRKKREKGRSANGREIVLNLWRRSPGKRRSSRAATQRIEKPAEREILLETLSQQKGSCDGGGIRPKKNREGIEERGSLLIESRRTIRSRTRGDLAGEEVLYGKRSITIRKELHYWETIVRKGKKGEGISLKGEEDPLQAEKN